MSKVAKKTSYSPPQGSVKSYAEFLKLLEKRHVPKVDVSFLKDHKIASGNEYKLIAGLKFLGLIDKDGNATEDLNNLCVVGEKRKENLAKVVRRAYSLLFDEVKLNLEKADPETLINTFKTDFNMGSITTARRAAQVFVFLAQEAGIPLSPRIREKLLVSFEKAKKPSKVAKQRRVKKSFQVAPESAPEPLPGDVLARFELKGVGYVDVKDKDTYEIAKKYMKLLAKKLQIAEE